MLTFIMLFPTVGLREIETKIFANVNIEQFEYLLVLITQVLKSTKDEGLECTGIWIKCNELYVCLIPFRNEANGSTCFDSWMSM